MRRARAAANSASEPAWGGTPFLSATQVFDIRPIPRKFLAHEKMETAKDCFVDDGTILVTRSGSVGRSTLAHVPHRGVVISDDLLRVFANDERDYGWLYAYLHAPQVRAMTIGAHYGHIIKHLETSHLDALPIPIVDDATAVGFSHRVSRILDLRNEGHRLTLEAEACFEKALGLLKIKDWGENGFAIRASKAFLNGRRRFDASVHNPGASEIRRRLAKGGQGLVSVAEAGFDVWVPGRYKRIPAEDGVIYRDSADLFEVSPDLTKKFADCGFGDDFCGRVKSGWILMPCSGQVYGIIGTAVLATEALDDQVVSNHVIRIAPQKNPSVRVGYLLTALSHPVWGRPLIKALAFGSSVPEIDSDDLANLEFVRLKPSDESAIADLSEASAKSRAEADVLEREIAAKRVPGDDDCADTVLLDEFPQDKQGISRQPGVIEAARQVFGATAVALVQPHDVPASGPRLVRNARHVVRPTRALQPMEQDDGGMRCSRSYWP
mgnify:CR=1 FL=1